MDKENGLIQLAPGTVWAKSGAEDFADAIRDFSKGDLFVVRRLLEEVRDVAAFEGAEAALALLDRAAPCTSFLREH